jgi:hypothetical protein
MEGGIALLFILVGLEVSLVLQPLARNVAQLFAAGSVYFTMDRVFCWISLSVLPI